MPQINETQQSLQTTANAVRKTNNAAIRYATSVSDSSDKNEDQEAIDKLETSARNAAADARDATISSKDTLKRLIKKKHIDIKNTKTIKSGSRTIRKADNKIKNSVKATEVAKNSTIEAAKQAAITSQKVAASKKAEQLAKKSAKWIKKIVKGIIEALKRLGAALGSAAVPILLVLVLAALIGGILSSAFGIFFSGETPSGTTRNLKDVVLEINSEYNTTIEDIKTRVQHDEYTIEGSAASWADVLSVYAVYVTTKEDAMDVVHMTDDHVPILRDIFWQMTTVTYSTEKKTETKLVPVLDKDGNQKKDDKGNLLYKEEKITTTILHIKISHKSASEEASALSFNAEQMAELNELLDPKNASLWGQFLTGVGTGNEQLVNIAMSQLGNKGGEKFWRWAGRNSRCAWCALFVSWCADKAGILGTQIPYFSFVSDGVSWFKSHGKWISGSEVNPSNCETLIQPGTIIFFDWEPDGKPNHVGIVTRVENGRIYTVEGNSSDSVREKSYAANSNHLYGFGVIG